MERCGGVCQLLSLLYFGMAKYKGTSRKAVKQLEGVLPLAPSMVCLRKKKKKKSHLVRANSLSRIQCAPVGESSLLWQVRKSQIALGASFLESKGLQVLPL